MMRDHADGVTFTCYEISEYMWISLIIDTSVFDHIVFLILILTLDDAIINQKLFRGDVKKLVVLGGAHHKVEDPSPTPRQLW